ncbi:hypothetical protein ABVK25_002355 [Lepraria finkii]|uniref:Uncharacterized protein n=1 Tax=Lepraria finkii TaxID=1340010 RepID=A0ABR4BIS6_9LECA
MEAFDGNGPQAKKVKWSHQEEDDDVVIKGWRRERQPQEKRISEKLENENENRDKNDEEPCCDDHDSDNERRIKKKYRTTKYQDGCTDSEGNDEDESDVEESEHESETDSDKEMGEDETKEPESPESAYQYGNIQRTTLLLILISVSTLVSNW